ncbi:MAG: ribonuclease III [Nitrospira sp.]|nr:ribonuclease III [Nitrospira sp.]
MDASSSKNLTGLEQVLGHTFKNKSLLKEAITHKSFAHEQHRIKTSYNERMEFLGDSVLELIISEYLYECYADFTESDLSRIKSYTVQESTLAETARELDLGSYLLLGKGEDVTGGRNKASLLADAFEAVLAAVYLDSNYKTAREFILKHLSAKLIEFANNDSIFDYKTKFQEVSQSLFYVLPQYVTVDTTGPEHEKTFEVQVLINNETYGKGTGRTKKAAAQKAAEQALIQIRENHETDI